MKELIYLKKIQKWNSNNNTFYSNYHGDVQTDKGVGRIFDLVRDEDSLEVSQTLEFYINKANATQTGNKKLLQAINRLYINMVNHRVIARDLSTSNICCQKTLSGSYKLHIIDGIGHRYAIPLADHIRIMRVLILKKHFKNRIYSQIKGR